MSSLYQESKAVSEAATMSTAELKKEMEQLRLLQADPESLPRAREEIGQLMARIAFELKMRGEEL